MKKLLGLSVLYVLIFIFILFIGVKAQASNLYTSPITGGGEVQEQGLTDEQLSILQTTTDKFGVCIMFASAELMNEYGFTTEYAVTKSIMSCGEEAAELIGYMVSLGVNRAGVDQIMAALYRQAVETLDDQRNQRAKDYMEYKKNEKQI